jgi:CheY-like chemotaxis protein
MCGGDARRRGSTSGTLNLSGYEATELAEELREQSTRLKSDRSGRDAALDKPYHLFFFSAVDRGAVTRFFDIMSQENGFSVAETATSAPRLGRCIETLYSNPAGDTHHVHRNYGEFQTHTALQAMEEFARFAGVTRVTELAETLSQREALPTWKIIFEKLGCESLTFSPKSATECPTEVCYAGSNVVENQRILVVHHEQLIGELICKLLEQEGYETRMESSSADAMRVAAQFSPCLLIIDPVMPQISGLDAAKHIFGQRRCKVLLASAGAADSGFQEILRDLRGEGCDCTALGLPFEREELLELVRARIGSDAILS